MKITVYYEDNRDRTVLEVPDEECEAWVETDYRQRLAAAEDKSSVKRRTPQQIMDEECNKPTYNNQQREARRHVSLDALDPLGDTIVGTEDVEADFEEDEYSDLRAAIAELLPEQQELVRKVFWESCSQADIAREMDIHWTSVEGRMRRIYARLKKYLENF